MKEVRAVRGRQRDDGLTIYVVGTADTKGEELDYLKGRISASGINAVIVDVGTRAPSIPVDVPASEVARYRAGSTADPLASGDRGAAVSSMAGAFAGFMRANWVETDGVIGIGGGGGTSIVTAGMREMPLGQPKVMVSTLASGDTAPYVDVSDIVMVPAVTDLAGLNRVSRTVLHNAAQAIAGMVARPARAAEGKPAIGLTMFGVTTPCVTAIAEALRDTYDCMVFHATGTGGRAMEKLADSGMIEGVIDITTTEVCDLLFGGVLPATEDRFGAVARTKIPWVGSVGALDMVNFWAPSTVPEKHRGRTLYHHNPNVTLMRTTPDENRAIGAWIAAKLNACEGPVRLLIPERGVSSLDIEGGAFWDPEADAALFEAIAKTLVVTSSRRIERLPLHINDAAFAEAAVAAFRELARN
ncbi:MAG: Tm-1-like ATP-binding domain-containing protein [Rhizobiaceae bacterium]